MGDGNSSLILSSSDRNQHRNVPSAEYTHDSEDSDDTQSDSNITWSPGDRICLDTSQLGARTSPYDDWASSTTKIMSSHGEDVGCIDTSDPNKVA